MASYRCQPLAELARQMRYTPADRLRRQLDAAERLYWQLEPDRSYPASYVIYQITGYRGDEWEGVMLVGDAVRADLLTLVADVSDAMDETPDRYDPPPLTIDRVARRLGVTERSVNRYLKQGLFARKLIYPTPKGPRKKLAFLPASVERFAAARGEAQADAAGFSRIDEPTRHAILTRARRIAARCDASANRVAQHLARKYHRSPEAVRQLIRRHDERDPRFAIFTAVTPALTPRQQRIVHRAYRRGVRVRALRERFGKTREAIYRTIAVREADALAHAAKHHVASPIFDRDDAESVMLVGDEQAYDWLTPALDWAAHARNANAPREATTQPQTIDPAVFARMNYLKYRAHQQLARLNPYQPPASGLDAAATDLRRAAAIRRRIAWTSLPTVVSVARQHHGGRLARDNTRLQTLVHLGAGELLAAIDRFHASAGGAFTSYLRWALMRWFARHTPSIPRSPTEAQRRTWTLGDPLGDLAPRAGRIVWGTFGPPDETLPPWRDALSKLDPTHARLLTQHLGLPDADDRLDPPRPLADLSHDLRLEPDRARQAERLAIRTLRRQTQHAHAHAT